MVAFHISDICVKCGTNKAWLLILNAHLALYVLEVVDSVDGSSAAVAGHTDSSATSDVVRDLNRIGFIFRPFSEFDGRCKLSSRPAYQFS